MAESDARKLLREALNHIGHSMACAYIHDDGARCDCNHLRLSARITAALEKKDGGWMPIETAPKDGTMILVCLPRQGRLILRARFDPIHKHWLYDYRGEGGISNSTYFHNGDLWQPLPPLPKGE